MTAHERPPIENHQIYAQELHTKADDLEAQAKLRRERGDTYGQTMFKLRAQHFRKRAIKAEGRGK